MFIQLSGPKSVSFSFLTELFPVGGHTVLYRTVAVVVGGVHTAILGEAGEEQG